MNIKKTGKPISSQLIGRNFYGEAQLKEKELCFNITQFKKGGLYTSSITNQIIKSSLSQYLVFKNIDDLFSQVTENKQLYITDQNFLVVPFFVTYKAKKIQLYVKIPLTQINPDNHALTAKTLFKQIQQMSQQKAKVEQILSVPKLLYFVGDETNANYKSFSLSQNGRKVQKHANQWSIFNHYQPLTKQGIYSFKIESLSKDLIVGICGENIKSLKSQDAYSSPYFMGLLLSHGQLYGNNQSPKIIEEIPQPIGLIAEVEVNMTKLLISWIIKGKKYTKEISKDLANVNIYPMICMLISTVRLLHK